MRKNPNRLCTVKRCGRPFCARGLCNTHYARQRSGRPVGGAIRARRARPSIKTGDRFGRLTVTGPAAKGVRGAARWHWKCDCGTTGQSYQSNLKRGHALSCGCLARELVGERAKRHGLSRSADYSLWAGIIARCTNPNNKDYPKYSKVGICKRWLNFANFYKDMGPRPSRQHSIDRIKNSQGYSPSNCRWSTPIEQRRNQPRYRAAHS